MVPSYVTIDQFSITTDYGQGTASHKISDAWVYVDETLIGAFELPARVPILTEGNQNITIRPGIKINGIASTRAIYPYLLPVTRQVRLVKDSAVSLSPINTRYRTNVTFPWLEGFELSGLTMDTTSKSTVALQRTSDPALVFSMPGESNSFSGLIQLTSDTSIFEVVTRETYEFPAAGSEVFLEMNFKTTNSIVVGVFYKTNGMQVQRPLLVLNKSDEWNKIYVNLTVPKYDTPGATEFRIFIGAQTDQGNEQATILLDNLKLVHFNTVK
ncbi:MAG: hypothetical protein CVT94_10065 [Bacteroidetes bacterium HGW-Bacteroidetes-11]|nr:MAG: hypothetical protein CVT94_10065 [Bacteroidetes bacterium HGW-Bacteroidetes-11]